MAFLPSSDQTRVHFEVEGSGSTALLFVHGWLGCGAWWDAQRDYFVEQYRVVQMDLPGHGLSTGFQVDRSSKVYSEAIKNVADQIDVPSIVLIGHSMAGAYVLEASLSIPRTKAVVLVDTLKNLDQMMSYEQAVSLLFKAYRSDFRNAVENILPKYLFAESTPQQVKERLQREFLENSAEQAVKLIEPLYLMNIPDLAQEIKLPVRSINSDMTPTNREGNQRYVADYDYSSMSKVGHYPMLERPEEFNRVLAETLASLQL